MALTIEIDSSKIDNIGEKTTRGIRRYLEDGADKGHAIALDRVPVDRGTLQQQVASFTPEWDGERLIWGVRDSEYAKPMEFGTEPFYPPVQPLLEWSKRVSGDTGLGWYVARHKIPEEGITAHPYARPGRDAQAKWYESHSADDYIQEELD